MKVNDGLKEYTAIPNYFLDEIMSKLNGSELKLLLTVARKTIGWRKKEDWISSFQLAKMMGTDTKTNSRAIEACVTKGYLEVRDERGMILDGKGMRRGKKLHFGLGNSILERTFGKMPKGEIPNGEMSDNKRNSITPNKENTEIGECPGNPLSQPNSSETKRMVAEYLSFCRKLVGTILPVRIRKGRDFNEIAARRLLRMYDYNLGRLCQATTQAVSARNKDKYAPKICCPDDFLNKYAEIFLYFREKGISFTKGLTDEERIFAREREAQKITHEKERHKKLGDALAKFRNLEERAKIDFMYEHVIGGSNQFYEVKDKFVELLATEVKEDIFSYNNVEEFYVGREEFAKNMEKLKALGIREKITFIYQVAGDSMSQKMKYAGVLPEKVRQDVIDFDEGTFWLGGHSLEE